MRRRRLAGLWCAVLIILSLVSSFAAARNEKPGFWGDGPRVNINRGEDVQYVYVDSPFFICHGWGSPRYPGSTPDYRAAGEGIETLGGALFELFIDGVQVDLAVQNVNRAVDLGGGTQIRVWYIQFQPGDLAPGEYEITGVSSSRNPQSSINVALGGGIARTITLVVEP